MDVGIKRRHVGALATFLAGALGVSCALATPSLVVDVSSGQVLSQEEATASWYPASLTKLMTTYVALDAVRSGRMTLDTPLVVSPRATRMAPSKMGFRAGSEVTLGNALIMLMVKSANDIAVTIAEGVGGSVEGFAEEMNRTSASLGMTQSHWVNPNGLPDKRQVTSARDLAILGRALLTHFPEYAYLYNIGAMQLGNRITPTHNGLLGRYPGADGMKTGFTCPAGFNLVASASRGGQRLIAVILGAPSASARTAKAAALLDRGFQAGQAQGALAGIEAGGPGAAPDMREKVCHNRGAATAEFMTEVDSLQASTGGVSPALGLFSALSGDPQMNPRDVAHLPRPHFQPVQVFVGRTPGAPGSDGESALSDRASVAAAEATDAAGGGSSRRRTADVGSRKRLANASGTAAPAAAASGKSNVKAGGKARATRPLTPGAAQ
jgi:D-alanyl-D-alanine carboxypeptidase